MNIQIIQQQIMNKDCLFFQLGDKKSPCQDLTHTKLNERNILCNSLSISTLPPPVSTQVGHNVCVESSPHAPLSHLFSFFQTLSYLTKYWENVPKPNRKREQQGSCSIHSSDAPYPPSRSLFLTYLGKKILPLLAVLCLCFTPLAHTFAQSSEYEITCAGIGVQGTYLVKVTSYGKTVEKAQHQLKKDAVHGVLFKGLSGSCHQKPIIADASIEEKYATFFATFFKDGGAYINYISMDADQVAVPVKVGRQYKVSMVVSVKKDALRKCMEKEGIIRPLGL